MIVLAHLSDTHFDGGQRSAARAGQVMDYLHALPGHLDAIIVTGDITDHGLPEEHEQAEKVLRSSLPVHTCPGNHDGYTPYAGPLNSEHDLGEATLILCDSVIMGRDDGEFSDETLDWLAATLAAAAEEKPVLIGFHHPPVDVHHGLLDTINLGRRSQERLAALMAEHPKVVALLCGHVHSAAAATFAGRPVLMAPGVTSTLNLPWEVSGELTWKNTVDYGPPPALAFHVIADNGRVTTHFRWLPA
ncbi:3',5'-cyclic adenosine monophosphate phosphodiesterase CpdA [Rhizocola hellebori]|uniref:3',5'-cyclic adenosine monophosphate phosphodiesterase CpdA n=1 Tax=Rhizocola hellebori TaxID=1392758 RepID=A0A8J3Q6D4_9ACTN|nr:metallophosphoesterase [Rhizocola hellebori]GIH04117.1 3',5'-cyclic adenosine monophosphate phosphodiesterase CpdA [Rhizocola hellebori]